MTLRGLAAIRIGRPRGYARCQRSALTTQWNDAMHKPFTHYLAVLIVIIAGTTVVIAVAVRLLFRRGRSPLDL